MTGYRTTFLSDIHLGSTACQTSLLLNFLKTLKTDKIFLVGDIIDLWALKRNWFWPLDHNEVVRAIFEFSDTIPLIYVIGNHDELLGFLDGYQFGNLKICRETIHQMVDGRKLLVIHGDAFDLILKNAHWLSVLGSAIYDYLIIANIWINRLRSILGWPYWSLAGALKHRVKDAGNFIQHYERIVTEDSHRKGYDGVISGHIHVPAIKTIGDQLYMNIGDMVDSCTVLVEDHEGNFSHIHLR